MLFRPDHDELLAPDSMHWQNQGNTMEPNGPSPVRLKAVLAASSDCRGVRIPIVDGRLERPANDPCDVRGKDRIELSDGTVCFGWPIAVIDRRDGREIVADPNRLQLALQQIVDEQRTVVFAGQKEADRCSPSLVRDIRR
jgi:hypothetical protein